MLQRRWFILFGLLTLIACGRADATQPLPVAPIVSPVPSAPPAPPTAAPTVPSIPAPAPSPTAIVINPTAYTYALELVADGFSRPTHLVNAGDGSGRLFVVEQEGRIWILRDGQRLPEPFLDLRRQVGARGNEQGLLSLVFHPQFAANGRLFVNYTNTSGDTVVAEYRVSADPNRVDLTSAREILHIEQPAANHNGGLLLFGPDGYLYIGTGDGGSAGDPLNAGQRLDTLLGKLLRIDVDTGEPYAIPPDNPFVDTPGARPEIWAYGLRNPWRFAFDEVSGMLFIADVGQNALEEVNVAPVDAAGLNYGWRVMEGDRCFRAAACDQTDLVLPAAVYPHDNAIGGCSVTGGEVYRGSQQPGLTGLYFYADFCSGNLWALWSTAGGWQHALVARLNIQTTSFGRDEAGEIYLLDRAGGVYRLLARPASG